MSVDDTLSFADHDVVTGPPNVDGFTGIQDPFVITFESDAGYVLGSRLEISNSSALSPVIFQGVKNGNFINLAFLCRLDLTFDAEDVVVLAVRPDIANVAQTTARRIDIFPVYEGVGADEKNTMTGGPAGASDDSPPGVPTGEDYHIRTNHAAQNVLHYRGQASGNPWTTLNPDSSVYNPSNITIKTRSWLPPVPTATTASGAQTITLGGSFNVASTTLFPSAGVFSVAGRSVRYTSKTGTSFINCTGFTGSIPVMAGAAVSIPEVAWSIEVQLPLTSAAGAGGPTWIDFQNSFALYFAVIRVGKTAASGGTTSQGWFSTQFRFPVGTSNFLTGALNDTTSIPANWYGTGLLPPNTSSAVGVHFHNDLWGVGARDILVGGALGHIIRGALASGGDNQLVAQVDNSGPAANNVRAEFRFANWGLGPPSFPSWALPSGATEDQPSGITVPTSSTGAAEITWTWPKASVPSAYAPPHQHQCVWVQLKASGVNFNQSSVRRNMDFAGLSELRRPATISGVGYPPPAGGSHDFLLITNVRRFEARQQRKDDNYHQAYSYQAKETTDTVYWIWIVQGYRRTGRTLNIKGRDYEVLDNSPGAFGTIAHHEGVDAIFTSELSGGGIQNVGGNIHALRVPHNGSVEIETRIAATKVAPVVGPSGCLGAFFAWLKGLFS